MTQSNADLATLIGSRICHDLISPIGAIGNGLELMDLAGGDPGPERALIADSVDNAGARIRFFRIAFGAAGDQMLGQAEIESILRDLTRGGRTEIAWQPAGAQGRAEVRLAFLAILCCETAMPRGGRIAVDRAGPRWTVTAADPRLAVDPDLWARLSRPGRIEGITPALVQFALLPLIARDMGRRVTLSVEPGSLTLEL